MWAELATIYKGKTNFAKTLKKLYRLQVELHKIYLRERET